MSGHGPTRRDLLARLLREAGSRGVTTNELLAAGVGSRYSARLLELRERGYEIASERVRDGQWRYELLHEPARAASGPSAPPVEHARVDQGARLFDGFERGPASAVAGDEEAA